MRSRGRIGCWATTVFFLTGTDEHGQKVERAAQKAGLKPTQFADRVAQKFRDLLPALEHRQRRLHPHDRAAALRGRRRSCGAASSERGFIYKGKYEGWYCTVDEVFVPDTQLQDGRCPICGNAVERIAEESYFFKLSAFQEPLLEHYRRNPEFVTPAIRRNEMMAFLEGGLEDLSVSRTSFKWGIPVPDDPAHVMYVWFDALTNYMTAVGFGAATRAGSTTWWPADVHLIGKEIVRQHAIYWPAFLMAADLPLPRQIVSHGWWLMDGAKMSKSMGNVVRPQDYIDRFGLDALRYFVFREMVFGQDANFGDEAFLTRYNADLANDLGNLVSRATTMVHRYCGGRRARPPMRRSPPANPSRCSAPVGRRLIGSVPAAVRAFQLSAALREIWDVIGATNRYIVDARAVDAGQGSADRRAELDTALFVAADTLRVIAELLRPFMPGTAERTLKMLRRRARRPTRGRQPGARHAGARHDIRRDGAAVSAHRTVSGGAQTNGRQHPEAEAAEPGAGAATQHSGRRSAPAPYRRSLPAPCGRQPPERRAHLDRRLHESRAARREGAGGRARAEVEQAAEAAGRRRHRAADDRRRHRRGLRARGARRPDGCHRLQPEAGEADGRRVERDGARGEPRGRQGRRSSASTSRRRRGRACGGAAGCRDAHVHASRSASSRRSAVRRERQRAGGLGPSSR